MGQTFLWIVIGLTGLHVIAALFVAANTFLNKNKLQQWGLYTITVLGPLTLFLCWETQNWFRANDAVFWGRLMAGDVAQVFRLGSVGLIVGSGLGLAALASTISSRWLLYPAALIYAGLWYIVFKHPVPHYVPIPDWLDKIVWFVMIVGGAGAIVGIYHYLYNWLRWLAKPLSILAVLVSLLSGASIAAQVQGQQPIDLAPLDPMARVKDMGCLSCHSIGDRGYPDPGGGLESVASRTEDVVVAFLKNPDAETAKELGIRTEPTGEMAGVHLTDQEVQYLTEALKSLFEVQPPSMLGPGWKDVEEILAAKTCLACHSLGDEGAPQGGIGGPLEASASMEQATLVEWLMEPTPEKAQELGISDAPMGAMVPFALPEDQAQRVAEWLKTLESEG